MHFTMEELRGDLQILSNQKEQTMQNYHQVCGAYNLLEQQIKILIAREEENKSSEHDDSEKNVLDESQEQ